MTAGLYLHIPFCTIRCGYCDFYTVTNGRSAIPSYLEALKREVRILAQQDAVKNLNFATIYFGGGTPSLLAPQQIAALIDEMRSQLYFEDAVEITIEVNPGTVDLNQLQELHQVGVNRLSTGVQSFQENELKFLDRDHSTAQSVQCIKDARKAGFENINLDLIFGLPKQKVKTWQDNLRRAAELEPEHISAYNLTFEDGTPLTRQLKQGVFKRCPEESERAMQLAAIEILGDYGYPQYEISNYARPGFESRHNRKYWDGSPYLGLGASAHSLLGGKRVWNVRNYKLYTAQLIQNKLAIAGEEELGQDDVCFEHIFLGLRQRQGVHLREFENRTGVSFFEKYRQTVSKLFDCQFNDDELVSDLLLGKRNLKATLLEFENGFLRLTEPGILMCDTVCAEFV